MSKTTRAPRRRAPTYSATITAALTGAPFPDPVSRWDAYKIEHPDEPGLIGAPGYVWSLADAWRQYHGREMTKGDRAALRARLPDLRAALEHATRPTTNRNNHGENK